MCIAYISALILWDKKRVEDGFMGVKYDAKLGQCLEDEERIKVASTWHWTDGGMNVLESVKPFINNTNYWLTVGDGRFGTDDQPRISEKLLKIGNAKITAQNAEKLSFADNSFDYVLIKATSLVHGRLYKRSEFARSD